jgi:hypothetical protein
MNVRITRPHLPGRSVLYGGVTRITCDGVQRPSSGASLWLDLHARFGPAQVPIGGLSGGIELVLNEDGGVCD